MSEHSHMKITKQTTYLPIPPPFIISVFPRSLPTLGDGGGAMTLQRARRAIGVVARVGPSRGTVRVKKTTAVHQIVNISGASCPSPVYAPYHAPPPASSAHYDSPLRSHRRRNHAGHDDVGTSDENPLPHVAGSASSPLSLPEHIAGCWPCLTLRNPKW
jgi:hypothetical protein